MNWKNLIVYDFLCLSPSLVKNSTILQCRNSRACLPHYDYFSFLNFIRNSHKMKAIPINAKYLDWWLFMVFKGGVEGQADGTLLPYFIMMKFVWGKLYSLLLEVSFFEVYFEEGHAKLRLFVNLHEWKISKKILSLSLSKLLSN